MASLHTLHRGYKRLHLNEYSGDSPFNPASYGGLILWLNPQNGLTDKTDAAPVSIWNSAPNSIVTSVTQATATNQPRVTYSYFGNMPSVYFDGSNDYLVTASPSILPATFTVIAFYHSLRISPTGQIITSNVANYQWRVSNYVFAYSNGKAVSSGIFNSPVYNVSKMLTGVCSGGLLTFYDSKTLLTGAGGFGTYVWDAIGRQWGSEGTWFQGAIAELIIYNFPITTGQLEKLHDSYFKIKYAAATDFV